MKENFNQWLTRNLRNIRARFWQARKFGVKFFFYPMGPVEMSARHFADAGIDWNDS